MAVYMIRAGADGPVKIGYTANAATRLRGLQTGQSETLFVLRYLIGDRRVETALHQRFAHLRLRGEWFTFSTEMLDIGIESEVPSAPPQQKKRSIINAEDRAAQWKATSRRLKDTKADLTPTDVEDVARGIGIPVSEICRRIGVVPSIFGRWKAGQTGPRLDTYRKFHSFVAATIGLPEPRPLPAPEPAS